MSGAGNDERTRRAAAALVQRLGAAARVLLDGDDVPWQDAGGLLDRLCAYAHRCRDDDVIWLLLTALTGVMPTSDEVVATRRAFELNDLTDSTIWLLEGCARTVRDYDTATATLEVITGSVIVDTDFSARHDLHTGIQRVVRTTVPIWSRERDITAVVWTDRRTAMRSLIPTEADRLLRWTEGIPAVAADTRARQRLIVPWRSVVVLAEVPSQDCCPRLAAIAQHSGNRVVAIGYDCIPIASADMVPPAEANKFVDYLEVVKHCRRVAGISVSAALEFDGFSSMLPAQGLTGPLVSECPLPIDATGTGDAPRRAVPLVLCVGSFEPRKNQEAVLHAAEQLWREGVQFELQLIGGGGSGKGVARRVLDLRAAGRPVSTRTAISEAELTAAYRSARFTVFPSLHEGYGLPVAESLAFGVPAVATGYGSTREIAEGGGVVLVDPRDDAAILAAMRDLLLDEAHLDELRREIEKRPQRTWNDYAGQLWDLIVAPELDDLAGPR